MMKRRRTLTSPPTLGASAGRQLNGTEVLTTSASPPPQQERRAHPFRDAPFSLYFELALVRYARAFTTAIFNVAADTHTVSLRAGCWNASVGTASVDVIDSGLQEPLTNREVRVARGHGLHHTTGLVGLAICVARTARL